jgi:hypothetical protein
VDDPLAVHVHPQFASPKLHPELFVPTYGDPTELFMCQASPPRKMKLSPGWGVVEAQVAVQFGIPGAWSHGVDTDVPLFASAPLAAM